MLELDIESTLLTSFTNKSIFYNYK
jgi:hypothetical protein